MDGAPLDSQPRGAPQQTLGTTGQARGATQERILVLTGDNRHVAQGGELGYWSYAAVMNAAYARRHGYAFQFVRMAGVTRAPDGATRGPQWAKLAAIWHALDSYDLVMWIDSDAAVAAHGAPSIASFLAGAVAVAGSTAADKAALIAVTNAPYKDSPACSGIMWVRNSPAARVLLRLMWSAPHYADAFPYEQAALTDAVRRAPQHVCILDVPSFVTTAMPPPEQVLAHVTHLVSNRREVLALLHARLALGDVWDGVRDAYARGCVLDAHPSDLLATMLHPQRPSVKLFVLCSSPKRRALLSRQFAERRMGIPLCFIDAWTPETSADYLPAGALQPEAPVWERASMLCCTRTHGTALAYAGGATHMEGGASDFAVIMEDDCALRFGFQATVFELASRWSDLSAQGIDYVSLGYLPPSEQAAAALPPPVESLRSVDGALRLPDPAEATHVFGSQCYMLPRAAAARMAAVFCHGSAAAVAAHVCAEAVGRGLDTGRMRLNVTKPTFLIDWIMPHLLRQAIVHPPAVIEYDVGSTVARASATKPAGNIDRWVPFLRKHGLAQSEYWSI